jgi:hypothetical protein
VTSTATPGTTFNVAPPAGNLTPPILADTAARLDTLFRSPAWRQQWSERHNSPAGWESAQRVTFEALGMAKAAAARGDVDRCCSLCLHALAIATGELWGRGANNPIRNRLLIIEDLEEQTQ